MKVTVKITPWHVRVVREEARRCRLKAQAVDGQFQSEWLARAKALDEIAEHMEDMSGADKDD